jgi:hypothetical protein
MTAHNHPFTKAWWNKIRIRWAIIVGLSTSIPIVGGSLLMVARWTEANYVSPYITCKIDSICEKKQEPLKQDIKTMISDLKFMRGCAEKTTPREIQDVVISEIKLDSIQEHKYNTK